MPVAVFNSTLFLARYPEFAAVSPTLLTAFFGEAGLYLSNSDTSPVQNVVKRGILLNMITAHIAYLAGVLSADGLPLPVGRISQAAEGSVSASFEGVPPTPGTGAWFQQTQYGAAFWQATTNLRGMRYIPAPGRHRPQVRAGFIPPERCEPVCPPAPCSTLSLTASVNISGWTAVAVANGEAITASSSLPGSAVGIATGGAVAGSQVTVQYEGALSDPSWAWTPNQPIFIGTNGVLTQTAPTVGYSQIVGYPISTTSMQIDLQAPITL